MMSEEGIGTIPKFLPFSGSEPKSSEESGIEEFLFQIKGARLDNKDEAIRIAILMALRGEAQKFVEFIGPGLPLDDMLQQLKEKFWRKEEY